MGASGVVTLKCDCPAIPVDAGRDKEPAVLYSTSIYFYIPAHCAQSLMYVDN